MSRIIAIRTVLGIPADLSWRAEYGLFAKTKGDDDKTNLGRRVMNTSVVQRGMTFFAVLAAVSFIVMRGSGTLSLSDPLEVFVVGSPILVIAGIFLTKRSPLLGAAMVVVGALMMAVSFYWLPPLWLVALLVLVIGVYRARRFSQR